MTTTAPVFCPHCDRPEADLLVDDTDHWACPCGGHGHLSQLVTIDDEDELMPGVVLRFDRLPDGTLIAVHQGVAAIVHPAAEVDASFGRERTIHRYSLAGDGFPRHPEDEFGSPQAPRPCGWHESRVESIAMAAAALGTYLGVTIDGYETAP